MLLIILGENSAVTSLPPSESIITKQWPYITCNWFSTRKNSSLTHSNTTIISTANWCCCLSKMEKKSHVHVGHLSWSCENNIIQMQTIVCFSVTVKWLFKSKTWRKSQVWEQNTWALFLHLGSEVKSFAGRNTSCTPILF